MRLVSLALIPALVVVAACGSEKKAPPAPNQPAAPATSGQPGMPAGHPPVSQMPPGHPPMTSSQADAAPVSAEAPAGSPVTWTVPEGWTATRAANQMRIANFRVAETAGAPVEVVVFGGIGGTAQQNIQRWIGQFELVEGDEDEAKVSETELNGLKITRLDLTGKFGGGMAMGAGADPGHGGTDYRVLAAVIEGAEGPVQVKLVGPAQVVGEQASAFDAFIASIRPAQ